MPLSGHLSFIYCTYELCIFFIKNHRVVNSDLDPGFIALVSGRMIVGLIVYAIAIAYLDISHDKNIEHNKSENNIVPARTLLFR
jgi:hypothetical protein